MRVRHSVDQRWAEYRDLWARGACYAAVLRLAEIYSVRDAITEGEVNELRRHGLAIKADPAISETLRGEMGKNVSRVRRVLSSGRRLLGEEFLLVITIAVQLDLLAAFLEDLGVVTDFEVPADITSEIKEAGLRKGNERAYASAVSSARLNWGLPVKHPLL